MTILRTAFFEADLNDEQKEDFYQYMENTVIPIIRTFPNNNGVVISKPEFIESEDHQHLLLMLQHSYKDKPTMDKALNSDARLDSMHATNKIIEKYNISVHHMNFMQD
tara:strand:- start:915 stop:1238 length:324 start_codon:yes stop_codon:yes gene_type:complete